METHQGLSGAHNRNIVEKFKHTESLLQCQRCVCVLMCGSARPCANRNTQLNSHDFDSRTGRSETLLGLGLHGTPQRLGCRAGLRGSDATQHLRKLVLRLLTTHSPLLHRSFSTNFTLHFPVLSLSFRFCTCLRLLSQLSHNGRCRRPQRERQRRR